MVSRNLFSCLLLLSISAVSAQSESNDSPDVSGGLLAGGIFPPELLAGNSLRQVFSNTEVSDAMKGLQSLLSGFSEPKSSPVSSYQSPEPVDDISTISNKMAQDDGVVDASEAKPDVMPVRFQMLRPLPMPSMRSLFQGMHNSPIRFHVIPFGNGFSSTPDFSPISRPLKSIRSLAQGAPLFSRSITISSDGTKTVRQETSRDMNGNLVTTTTTTTTTTQKPDVPQDASDGPAMSAFDGDASFSSDSSSADETSPEVSASSDAASSSADRDAQILFKSVMEEMPSELKDLLGLTGLSQEFDSVSSQAAPVQRKLSAPGVDQDSNARPASTDDSTDDATDEDQSDDDAANDSGKSSDDNSSADDDEDDDTSDDDDVEDVLDEVLNGEDADSEETKQDDAKHDDANEDDAEDQTGDERKPEDSKPFVVQVGENNLDAQSMGAVLNAVADKLNISPQDMEVVEKMPTADSGAGDDSSVKAWEQAGATSVETAHHQASPDSEAGMEEEEQAAAKPDAMSDNSSDEIQSEQARSLEKDVVLARLEALESRLQ